MTKSPIFIAGPDRSGTTLLYALLASHPNIAMVRRTNFWRWFYGRYGDLAEDGNFERLLKDLLRYKRSRPLQPDAIRIRKEFWQGEPSYGRVFSLLQEHNAERLGKPRWGDKSLHTEHYVHEVVREFPDARIIHMCRDPRDRFASVRKRFGGDARRVGAATARWLVSMRRAQRNLLLYPRNYKIVRFEDLATDPEETMKHICAFIGEEYTPEMLTMRGASRYRESGGNSSFGQIKPGTISKKPVGRFRDVLSEGEIAFIQLFAGRLMSSLGYRPEPVHLGMGGALRFCLWVLPMQAARMLGWTALTAYTMLRSEPVPKNRFSEIEKVNSPRLGDLNV
jgi:hypothetical protein